MRFGYCTGFASTMTGEIAYTLLEDIQSTGFDYVEFPLMQLAALEDGAFACLEQWLAESGLAADCACNMFPPSLRLTGPVADPIQIKNYLDKALERLARLGTHKIVLGSSGARNLPVGICVEDGYRQMACLLQGLVLPLLERYDQVVAIEPINRDEANFIRTLPEGIELVRRVGNPRVRLLADTIHMLREEEDGERIQQYIGDLEHIHISELGRNLPSRTYTTELQKLLDAIRTSGYQGTVSFETGPANREEMERALKLLKATLS